MRSAAFFVRFSVSLASPRKFNQFLPLRCRTPQVTVSKVHTEFYRPLSSIAVQALSFTALSANRGAI